MLLYQNKKNQREFYIHSKRPPHRTVSPSKTKAKLIDSPLIPQDKIRLFRTLQLRCQGMKLKARDVRIPQSVKRKISQTISQTVPFLKPVLSLLTPPVFSSLQIKSNNFVHAPCKAINPQTSSPPQQSKFIPKNKIILSNQTRINELKEGQGFYLETNRYVGLHQCQYIEIPKLKGVLEECGYYMSDGKKYYVTQPYLGHSFRNLIGQFGKLVEFTAKYFLRQLITTVSSLHQLGISHNRLNMDSIIHDCEGNLLINFFKAKNSPINEIQRQQYIYFFSPEMLMSKSGHYSFKNDIWAIGSIALQFLSNKQIKYSRHHPYNTVSLSKSTMISSFLAKKIQENNNSLPEHYEEHLSSQTIEFITACLQTNQRKRPTAKELLSHSYLCD